jgi:hypothetical protein
VTVLRGYRILLGTGAVAGVLLMGGIAFAHSCTFVVTGTSLQSVFSKNGSTYIDVAITVTDMSNVPNGTWEFPNAPTPGNGVVLPEITAQDTSTKATVSATADLLVSNSQPFGEGQSGTAVYQFDLGALQNPGDNYSIQLDPTFGHDQYYFHVVNVQGGSSPTAPVCQGDVPPIQGELPEVPFAAGLPLVGIGMAGFFWYKKTHRTRNRPA